MPRLTPTLAAGSLLAPETRGVAVYGQRSSQQEALVASKVTVGAVAERGVGMAAVHPPVMWRTGQ